MHKKLNVSYRYDNANNFNGAESFQLHITNKYYEAKVDVRKHDISVAKARADDCDLEIMEGFILVPSSSLVKFYYQHEL